MRIRCATHDDVHLLVKMGAAFIHESPTFSERGYIPEKAAAHFKWLIDGNGVIFLAIDDGKIVGGFAGGIVTDWQSDHKLAFDYVMYVLPKYRSSGVAKLLAETFVIWAKEMGANRINCGTATMINPKHCIDLYQSLGFNLVGAFLEMEV